jgi:hypothetical protein
VNQGLAVGSEGGDFGFNAHDFGVQALKNHFLISQDLTPLNLYVEKLLSYIARPAPLNFHS